MRTLVLADEPQLKKNYFWMMTTAVAIFYTLSVLLGIVYSVLSNNIVYMSSFLMYVIELGLQLLDIALYATAFSFFILAIERYGFRRSVPFLASFLTLAAVRRLASLGLEALMSGAVGADDISSSAIYFGLDAVTGLIVIAIACYEFHKYHLHVKGWQKIQRARGNNITPPALYPFEKVYSNENPLQVCALKIAILLSGEKILSRIIFDLYYGAPTSILDLLIMIIYYLFDILLGVLAYTAIYFLLSFLLPSRKEK